MTKSLTPSCFIPEVQLVATHLHGKWDAVAVHKHPDSGAGVLEVAKPSHRVRPEGAARNAGRPGGGPVHGGGWDPWHERIHLRGWAGGENCVGLKWVDLTGGGCCWHERRCESLVCGGGHAVHWVVWIELWKPVCVDERRESVVIHCERAER